MQQQQLQQQQRQWQDDEDSIKEPSAYCVPEACCVFQIQISQKKMTQNAFVSTKREEIIMMWQL